MNEEFNVTYTFKGCENKTKEEIKELINTKLLKVILILEKQKDKAFNEVKNKL